ncbi:MAG: peptidylprolyl isomerase [Gammaproteobacteria bacterium]|nr:peptidylprolyl isomerase [Gammaproteobacteria bacterium]
MSPMKTIALATVLFSTAFISACDNKPESTSGGTATVAVVNGVAITQAAYDAYAQQRAMSRPATDDAAADRKATLEELINRELIYDEAVKKGLDKKPDIAAEIANQTRNILAGAVISDHIESTKFTDEAMRKEYESRIGAMTSKEYRARHILVKTEDEANDLIAQLDKGGDFAALAKAKSQDTGSAKEGGDLNWFEAGQMVQPFGDAVKTMEKDTYTKTPVQTQFGWHIIKLEDTRDIQPPEFEKVKDNVRSILQNKEVETYLATLKSKAKIEIKDAPAAKPAEPAPAAVDAPPTEADK